MSAGIEAAFAPNWSAYHLARRNAGLVQHICRQWGIDALKAEALAHDVATLMCFRPEEMDEAKARRYFLSMVRHAARTENQRRKIERNESDMTESLIARSHASQACTEETAYMHQVVREIELLPERIQRIAHGLIDGDNPIEIALREKLPVAAILKDIDILRGWLHDAHHQPLLPEVR